jgi:Mrp family chromosome partitioning ATPase
MSNIFDALNRQRSAVAKPKEPLVPVEPDRTAGAVLPAAGDAQRDLEMERLRQRVFLELGPLERMSLVFTGTVDGEGATTLALLFARELARAEQKPILLIDADIEGSSGLSRAADGELPSAGFTDLLEGKVEPTGVLLSTEQPNLHFLPRGRDHGAPLDIIKIDRVRRLLTDLHRHYAFIVIDASPLLSAPEAGLIAAAADGTLVVVRARRTRREVVQKGLRLLAQSNCRVVGAVLNDRRYPIPSFFYRRL